MNKKDRAIAEAVKSAVREFDPSAEVVLFGSRARGDARQDSDYDFLVLLNVPLDFVLKEKILDRLYLIELSTENVISPLIRSKTDWVRMTAYPIHQEISAYGIAASPSTKSN